jgi:hypothetical protein
MNGYSAEHVFTNEQRRVWSEATIFVHAIPELLDPASHTIRCHELARAVGNYFISQGVKLRMVDGKFGLVEHTWLEFTDAKRHVILDVYAVGSLPMVQLIDRGATGLLSARQYVEGEERTDIDSRKVEQLLVAALDGIHRQISRSSSTPRQSHLNR